MAACRRVFAVWFIYLTYLILLAGDVEKFPGPWKKSDFSIVHQNIRGLSGKIDLLSLFILQNEISIFGVTETLLVDKIPSALVNIDSYNFERKDRKASGGGVGVYVKSHIFFPSRKTLNLFVWKLFLNTQGPFSSLYCIVLQTRQNICAKTLQKTEKFNELLQKLNKENKEIIIIGDINCNYLDNNNNKEVKELLALNGFIQLVNNPTRNIN